MKKLFLPLAIILLLALVACGDTEGLVDQAGQAATRLAEEGSGAVATAAAVATDVADGPDDPAPEDTAEPEPGPMDRWAGTVTMLDGGDASGVTVNIGGAETQSDTSGNFELSVPHAQDGRYVINAEKEGYLPISQLHIGSNLENLNLEFKPVETFTFDAADPVDATDSMGTQIQMDGNQLVDEDGNPAEGEVTLSIYTYDLEQEEMVGDMSALNSDGDLVSMESEGAFFAEFSDEEGNELNLADGAEAEISIPCEPNPNDTLTVWSYNEETGLWEEEPPVVTLDENGCSANVSHFSYWNFDYEKRTPSCIKLEVEQSYLDESSSLNVRAVLQTNPVTVRDLIISEQINVLINLPNNTEVKFYRAPDYTNAFYTVNSGDAWGGTGVPAFPYDVCDGVAEIVPAPTTGTLTGQVTDAVSGDPIAGAQVCINGTDLCATTDASGNYTIADAPAGPQTLSVTADSYIAVTDQAVTIVAGETTERPVALSPELAEGELRIVLEWGEKPSDLDAYLTLPSGTRIGWNTKGQLVEGATLDVDDRDGFGPETITISQLNAGTYTFTVDNYSAYNQDFDWDMDAPFTESGAVVKVYRGNQVIATYNVPTTGSGNTWNVFTLDGTTGLPTEVNTLSP